MKYFLIAFALLFVSCKGAFVVDFSEEPVTKRETVSCNKVGYCHSCGISMSGDFECSYQFSAMCDGKQDVLAKYTVLHGHYEKEPDNQVTKERREVIRTLSACD